MTNRRFKDAGFEPILAYIILIFIFFWLSIYLFDKTEFAVYIYLFLGLASSGKLSETKRNEFLKVCFGNEQHKKIRIFENLICSAPFVIFMFYKLFFEFASLLIVLAFFLALLNFKTKLNYTIWTPFSKHPFEFTVGFRNTFYLIFIAYALTFVAVTVKNFNLGVFAMLLVFAITLSYYSKPENEYYVWSYNLNQRQFLLSKIQTAILFSSALVWPVVFILIIPFWQSIDVILIFLVIGYAFLSAIIVAKYSAFPYEMNISQGVLLALCVWFPPLLFALIPYLFKKSENRLSNLLK